MKHQSDLFANRVAAAITTMIISSVASAAAQGSGGETNAPVKLPEVVVEADDGLSSYAVPSAATATRSEVPLLETPVSVQVVPRQTIEDQAAIRLRDVFRNVSGVTPDDTSGNVAATESPIIRGFPTFNTFWNGFRLRGQSPSVLANIQQVEVLKGPGSVLYGQQEPGGLVNLVTKQPLASPYYSLEQRIGSFDYYETLLDIGGPIDKDGSVRYRLNGSYQNAGSFRDFVDNEQFFVAPVLTWMITPKTEFTLEGSYLHNDFVWDNGLVLSPDNYDPPYSEVLPRETFLQEPDYRSTREEIFASYRLHHEINEDWKVRHLFLFHRNEFDLNAFRVDGGSSAGPGDLTVSRSYDGTVPTATEFNFIFDTTYKAELGQTQHEFLAGIDFSLEPENGNTQDGLRDQVSHPINAFDPVYGADPIDLQHSNFSQERSMFGIYAQDHLTAADDRLHVLLGGRFDYVDQEHLWIDPTWAPAPGSSGSRNDSAFTFRGGVLYELTDWLHPYFSYSQGFVPAGSFTVEPVDPETSQQFDFGVKMPFFEERLVANLSVYQLTKDNVVGDSDGDGISENFGEMRSRGVEIDVAGQLYQGLSAIFTYAYTDTEVLNSDWLPIGGRFVGVPRHMGSAWLKYDFAPETAVKGLSLGTGVYLVDSRPGNTSNDFETDGYGRWDAFVRYRWEMEGRRALTAQVNVQNILDENYAETLYDQYYLPGAPLSVLSSVRLEF